jgi:hypothetical protein
MTQQAAASLNLTISSSSSSESANPECNLFDDFGVAVQILMGTLAFGSLLIKRTNEFPQRPWKIWMFDTTKQGLGACFSHFLNTTLGILFGLSGGGDACTWSESTQVLGYFPSFHFYFGVFVCVRVATRFLITMTVHKFIRLFVTFFADGGWQFFSHTGI